MPAWANEYRNERVAQILTSKIEFGDVAHQRHRKGAQPPLPSFLSFLPLSASCTHSYTLTQERCTPCCVFAAICGLVAMSASTNQRQPALLLLLVAALCGASDGLVSSVGSFCSTCVCQPSAMPVCALPSTTQLAWRTPR